MIVAATGLLILYKRDSTQGPVSRHTLSINIILFVSHHNNGKVCNTFSSPLLPFSRPQSLAFDLSPSFFPVSPFSCPRYIALPLGSLPFSLSPLLLPSISRPLSSLSLPFFSLLFLPFSFLFSLPLPPSLPRSISPNALPSHTSSLSYQLPIVSSLSFLVSCLQTLLKFYPHFLISFPPCSFLLTLFVFPLDMSQRRELPHLRLRI